MRLEPLLKAVVVTFVALFLGLYLAFLYQIWSAAEGVAPSFNPVHVGLAAILSGALGSAFAVAMGAEDGRFGITVRLPSVPGLLTVGLWAYALVGMAAILTYLIKPDETPGTIATLALVIAGYMAAIVTNAYKSVLPPR